MRLTILSEMGKKSSHSKGSSQLTDMDSGTNESKSMNEHQNSSRGGDGESELIKASKDLQRKLDLIERIRADLETEKISVPGIVVVGSQSAGKSSTMESICGIQFPTGEGMCTRCPTVVSLCVNPSVTSPVLEVSSNADFTGATSSCELSEVALHIERITEQRCKGSQVVEDAIYIRITSASGPVLTLTDIPGITAVSKEQSDISEVTERITRKYIQKDSNVVLVVIPAWEDFGNPVALKLAKDADPLGERTIGVVTKVDALVNANSDIVEKIQMARATDVELAQGFIAIRNRTKAEVAENVLDHIIRAREAELFRTDPKLKLLDDSMWGVPTLVDKVVGIQSNVVAAFIPQLLATLRSKISALKEEQKCLPIMITTDEEKRLNFFDIVQRITGEFTKRKDGRSVTDDPALNLCARFHESVYVFRQSLEQGLPNFLGNDFATALEKIVKESRGVDLENFMSGPVFLKCIYDAFEIPLARGLSTLVDDTSSRVADIFHVIVNQHAGEFPQLVALLTDVIEAEVEASKLAMHEFLAILLLAEKDIALTLNPIYNKTISQFKKTFMYMCKDADEAVSSEFTMGSKLTSFLKRTKKTLSSAVTATAADVYEMQVSLHCYAKVKRERMIDHIALTVRFIFFTRMSEKVTSALLSLQDYTRCLNADPDLLRKSRRIEMALERLLRVQGAVKDAL